MTGTGIELSETAAARLAPERGDEERGADRRHGNGQSGGRERWHRAGYRQSLGDEPAELAARRDPAGGPAADE